MLIIKFLFNNNIFLFTINHHLIEFQFKAIRENRELRKSRKSRPSIWPSKILKTRLSQLLGVLGFFWLNPSTTHYVREAGEHMYQISGRSEHFHFLFVISWLPFTFELIHHYERPADAKSTPIFFKKIIPEYTIIH